MCQKSALSDMILEEGPMHTLLQYVKKGIDSERIYASRRAWKILSHFQLDPVLPKNLNWRKRKMLKFYFSLSPFSPTKNHFRPL